MPKESFFKLKQEKKEKIIVAALNEFSKKSYYDVSISDIVNSSNISRGSFYIYFEDKWDIYSHLLRCVFNKIQERVKETLERGNNIFFAVLDIYDYIVIESNLDENINFITNILKNINPLIYGEIYENLLQNKKEDYLQKYCYKPSDFVISTKIEFDILQNILINNLLNSLIKVLVFKCNPMEVREELRIGLNIIKYGSYK